MNQASQQDRRGGVWADLSLFVTAFLWAVNLLVVKDVSHRLDPLAFNAIRMVLSSLVLGCCAIGETAPSASSAVFGWRFVAFASLSGIIYPLLFMTAITHTTAGNAGLLLSSMPAWTALISTVLLRERFPLASWLGLLVSVLGAALIAVAGGSVEFSPDYRSGNLLMLLAAICWASATVVSGGLLRHISPIRLAFWSNVCTTPIQLWWVAPQLRSTLQLAQEPRNYCALIYSGALSTGIAYATWHYGVQQLGASRAAIYQNVVTVLAVLGGWFVLGEPPRLAQVGGGLLIVAGLVAVRRRGSQTRRAR